MEIFVGIDPSMNSTGICILTYDDGKLVKEHFYIVKPNKLTKREQKAQDDLLNFDYILYNKIDLSDYTDNNHWHEYYKSVNMVELVDCIYNAITDISVKGYTSTQNINIVMEGISYGSVTRTKAVFDLAGLNYMVRQRIIKNNDLYFTITPPSEIKKFASGNGNCKKEVIIDLFSKTHKDLILPKLDDVADAYFMAKYARKIYLDEINDNNN